MNPARVFIHTTFIMILSPIILIIRAGSFCNKKKYTGIEKSGYQICLQNLKINSNSGYGIRSSSSKFNGIWTRDAFFASWGLFSINQYSAIKRTLMILIQFQRKDGLIPLRITKGSLVSKALGIQNKGIKKTYHLDINNIPPLDTCSQFIILMYMYINNNKDDSLFNKYSDRIDLAYKWITKSAEAGLLHQKNYGGWQYTLDIKGPILYTNVLYYRAVYCYEELNHLDKKKSNRIKKLIHLKYWNSKYLRMTPTDDNFSLVGNALAIIYDLVSPEEAELIITERMKMGDTFFVTPNRDTYNIRNLSISLELLGLADLHNELVHPWANLIFMAAILKHNNKYLPIVSKWFDEFEIIIKQYGGIYSCYNKNKKPLNRYFYENVDSSQLSGLYLFFEKLLKKKTFHKKYQENISSPEKKSRCRVS